MPTENVTKGIRMIYVPTCVDLTNITGPETLFQVPREALDLLCMMTRGDVFRYQTKEQNAVNADIEAQNMLENMKRKIRLRDYTPLEQETPYLYHLGR